MLADFDYELPPDAVAQTPVEPRDAARLLVDRGPGREPGHLHVRDLPRLRPGGDVVVVNSTRVLPARLHLHKPTGARSRCSCSSGASMAGGRHLCGPDGGSAGHRARSSDDGVSLEVGGAASDQGERLVRFAGLAGEAAELDLLARVGEVPLPPYITTALDDPERYQTTYAERPGSVAAPTAGLHLTPEVLDAVP